MAFGLVCAFTFTCCQCKFFAPKSHIMYFRSSEYKRTYGPINSNKRRRKIDFSSFQTFTRLIQVAPFRKRMDYGWSWREGTATIFIALPFPFSGKLQILVISRRSYVGTAGNLQTKRDEREKSLFFFLTLLCLRSCRCLRSFVRLPTCVNKIEAMYETSRYINAHIAFIIFSNVKMGLIWQWQDVQNLSWRLRSRLNVTLPIFFLLPCSPILRWKDLVSG